MHGCVSEETILDFVSGQLAAEAVASIEQHADGCATCLDLIATAACAISTRPPAPLGDPVERTLAGYRLLEPVGYGGAGIVYLAVHLASGERVALKTVRSQVRGALASIRREIHALDRVRHPGVVRILDHGVDEGRPWYAMELIAGRTLGEHLASLHQGGPGAPSLAETLGVLRRLAETLSFLHGQGIVHRDLKPQNVVIRPDGAPVLVDFGLAMRDEHPGRALLASAALVGGTPLYMAPEQLRGELLDPRADLYALGCILYQTVAGRPPFQAAAPLALAFEHLHEAPAPPSAFAPGLDPRLERLILKLLEKHPRDRIGYAEDVVAALSPWSDDRPPARPRPYVYAPALTGRADLLAAFDAMLDDAAGGRGALAFLSGESGAGKTRLVAEVASRARALGFQVVLGECMSVHLHGALHPFRPLLRAVADDCAGSRARADRLVGPRGRVLAAYEPALLDLPGQDVYPAPPPLAAQGARDRLLGALQETITKLSAEEPLLLVLDDLQWADDLSLDVLEQLSSGLVERHPILLIGAYRSEETAARIERLARGRPARSFALGPFDAAAIERMAASMLALDRVPEPLLGRVTAAAGGNPFFVAEYLRAAVDQGWIAREIGARWQLLGAPSLPGSLRELLDLRLAALSSPARRLAETASVLGREIDGDLLAAAAGLAETESMDAIEELVARSMLEELPGDRFRFLHDKLREATYAGLPPALRREMHRRAAIAVELGSGAARLSPHPVLAHHWARAEIYPRAVAHLEAAGEEALGRAAHAEAAGHFERAMDLLPMLRERGKPVTGERVARWHRRLGEAYYALGDLPRCEDHASSALAGLGHPLPRSRAGWGMELFAQLGRQAWHFAEPGRDVERSPARGADLKEAALAAARVAHRFYFAEDGLALVASSLLAANLAERAGLDGLVTLPYAQLGYVAGVCKLRPLADAYFARARRSAEAAGDVHELVVTLTHEALLQACDGRFAAAGALGQEALGRLEGAPGPQEREGVLLILAHVDLCAGRYEASMRHGSALRASARARANRQHEAYGLYAIARALIRLGDLDAAMVRLADARELLPSMPDDPLSGSMCDGLTALALLGRGDLEAAERMADAAMAAIRRARPGPFSLADGRDGAAEVYLALWEQARRAGAPVPASLVARAGEAGAGMRSFALLFAIGRPRWLLHAGRVQALHGRTRSAAWAFARAREMAARLGMPYEAARAARLLAG
jgi:eukaryotic-like serine/threonine-protein kinase